MSEKLFIKYVFMKNNSFDSSEQGLFSNDSVKNSEQEIAHVSPENIDCSYRKVKLLLKCDNSIFADEIEDLLNASGIVSRRHDERDDPYPGAYGAVLGIAVFVYADDYEKACRIIEPVLSERRKCMPFCPKCGSEDVVPIVHRRDYGTIISVLSVFLILFPILYMELPSEFGTSTLVANIMAWVMFIAGIVLLFIAKLFIVNYKCRKCGKKFNRV